MNTTQNALTFHVGIAPYTGYGCPLGNACYQLVNDRGYAVADCSIVNGSVDSVMIIDRLLPMRAEFISACMKHFRTTPPIVFGTSTH